MNNIEQHVVSLDLAKKLVEAGIILETIYRWNDLFDTQFIIKFNEPFEFKNYPAPLATELLEILPRFIEDSKIIYFLEIYGCNDGNNWRATYNYYRNRPEDSRIEYLISDYDFDNSSNNIPDALAKMALYLKENKYI